MDYLKLLTTASEEQPLTANAVPVPELARHFDKDQPAVFYVASLSALEKDRIDRSYVDYCERNKISKEDSDALYRSFIVVACLCDEDNKRSATTPEIQDALMLQVAHFGNPVIARLFNICNGRNRFLGLEPSEKKDSPTSPPKSGDGNGESPSVSATPRARRGSAASAPTSTPSSDSSPS